MSINVSTSPGIFWWQPAACLRVSGADAASFLQGQCTNDLRPLAPAAPARAAVYGLWLNVKGKVLADSFVLRAAREDAFWLVSYFSPAATLRERLESHVIADDVVIEDATIGWGAVSWLGADAGARAAALAAEAEGFAFRGRRTREENFECVFPVAQREKIRARLAGERELEAADIAARRIAAAIPAVPADIGPGDLPNEGGLEADAISYTKGCYLGQEVMARLKAMGQVRRRLLRVIALDALGPVPSLPAPLFAEGKKIGELRSVAPDASGRVLGLALLNLLALRADPPLALAADGAPAFRLVDAP